MAEISLEYWCYTIAKWQVWLSQLKSCWLHILFSFFPKMFQSVYDFYYGKWKMHLTAILHSQFDWKQQTEFCAANFHKYAIDKLWGQVREREMRERERDRERERVIWKSVINRYNGSDNNVSCNCCPRTLQSENSERELSLFELCQRQSQHVQVTCRS